VTSDVLRIERIAAAIYRVPLDVPVATSFGTMRDRPALLVRVTDADAAHGWGEVWCNWPASAAEHRIRLLTKDLAELVLDRPFATVPECFAVMSERVEIKALQSGEPGPYAQAIAGLDMALWDLAARRASKPLHALLAPESCGRVRAYASGIDVRAAELFIHESRASGYRDFKIKVGFGLEDEASRVRSLAAGLGPDETMAIDANQGWTLDQALCAVSELDGVPLRWLEEPLRVDAPVDAWRTLSERASMPLAGGENILSRAVYDEVIRARHLRVIQPDAAKWGGVTGCFDVAQTTRAAGLVYCPHFLGSGVGLAASAHLLAAAGGDGLLEIDVNPNPLRSEMTAGTWPVVDAGWISLPDAPGLGIEPDIERIARYRTLEASARAG
jgi:L-alanine-DL-glutamate epimerase-like enolase superfamily enzyme